ncbi:MAG: extradiol dioxygenase [Solirubrobacterales bacterium]|nr:extradiol dioxygenase [Solirubrobacterales bacterium]
MTANLVGINHVALEVSDVDAALEWYGRIFAFELRGRAGPNMAFIDMGDQFLALSAPREQSRDDDRHFGLVVDDKESVRRALARAGAEIVPTRGLRFVDPWGNNVEVVQYDEIQFSKTDAVLRGAGLAHLEKTEAARKELRDKGLADELLGSAGVPIPPRSGSASTAVKATVDALPVAGTPSTRAR